MPSVEVRLAPPEDPLPQVGASIQMLEKQRMRYVTAKTHLWSIVTSRVEEALMSKLEDVFNKMVCHSTGVDLTGF